MKHQAFASLLLSLAACATQAPSTSPADVRALRDDVARLQQSVDGLTNRLGHLETNISAASAEDEFTELTIDSALWPQDAGVSKSADQTQILCHVTEWRGFGKLKRFTKLADHIVYLEAEGQPPLQAYMAEGGISSDDGSTRFAVLHVPKPELTLSPGVTYHLRPRNENERYRWSIGSEVAVTAK